MYHITSLIESTGVMAAKYETADVHALIECPVCLAPFSQTKVPKILDCSHTVCVQCARSIATGAKLLCPVCRWQTNLPQGDVEKLPKNLTALQLAELQLVGDCQVCKKKGKNIQCFHCEQHICGDCLDKHAREQETSLKNIDSQLKHRISGAQMFKQQIQANYETAKSNKNMQLEYVDNMFKILEANLQQRRTAIIADVNRNFNEMRVRCGEMDSTLETTIQEMTALSIDIQKALPIARQSQTKQTIDMITEESTKKIKDFNKSLPTSKVEFSKVEVDTHIDVMQREIDRWGKVMTEKIAVVVYKEPSQTRVPAATSEPVAARRPSGRDRRGSQKVQVDYSKKGRMLSRFENWEGGGNTSFREPCGVAVDATSSEMFVADREHNKVYVFKITGEYIRSFGSKGGSLGQFNGPLGLCIKRNHEVIVCDSSNDRCQVFTPAGKCILKFGQYDFGGKWKMKYPTDVTVDNDDNMYVATRDNVKVFDSKGTYTRAFGQIKQRLNYIAWYKGMCVVCYETCVKIWSDRGKFICTIGATTDPEPLITTRGVTIDQNGNILVLDVDQCSVKVYSDTGRFISKFHIPECQKEPSRMSFVACIQEGKVVVSDHASHSLLFY